MTDEQKSYYAGVFDGDGHITISGYTVTAGVTNVYLPVLLLIKDEYGGGISPDCRNDKIDWRLQISNREGVANFLSSILPFLIIKKDQAILTLEYIKGLSHKPRLEYALEYTKTCHDLKLYEFENITPEIYTQVENTLIQPQFSETCKLAYAAGLIDTDGSIPLMNRMLSERYTLNVSAGNTHLPSMLALKHIFSIGTVRKATPKINGIKSGRIAWYYRAASKQAKEVLEKILPYLIIKKRRAELAIEFQSTKLSGRNQYTDNTEVHDKQDKIADELKGLQSVHFESEEEARAVLTTLN